MTTSATPTVERSYPLSAMQHGMLFNHLRAPRSGVDLEQMLGSFEEELSGDCLALAWAHVVAQHDVLRTRIRWEGVEAPVQEVLQTVDTPLDQEDLRQLDEAAQASYLATFLRDDRMRGATLDQAPVMRLRLFRLAQRSYRLVWTFPHILLDGGSFAQIIEEVFRAYTSLCAGDALAAEAQRPYGAYIAWVTEQLSQTSSDAAQFWRGALVGFSAANRFPAVPPEDETTANDRAYVQHEARLSLQDTSLLRDLALAHDVTLSTLVEAAWGLCVGDFSGDADVVIGVVRACRRDTFPDADATVGLFINTLPLRLPPQDDTSVADWLREVRRRDVAMRPFEHTPLAEVQAESELPGDKTLFHSVVVFNQARMGDELRRLGGAWVNRDFQWIEQTSFPLTLFAYAEPELALSLSRDPLRVGHDVGDQMLARLCAALLAMVRQPTVRVSDLDRIPDGEVAAVQAWNGTHRPVSDWRCVHELFEEAVRRHPHKVALVFRHSELTYGELDQRANHLAQRLRALGVGPDVRVGLFVERSLEMVVGMLGILKAGGAYVPLDPSYPPARIAMMINDAGVIALVTQGPLLARLPLEHVPAVLLEHIGADPVRDTTRVVSGVTCNDLAYVLFTSGSTGRPKGVMVEHRNVVNFFVGMDERLGSEPGVWLAVTSISFDISVLELLWTLTRGYEVVIHEDDAHAALRRDSEAYDARPTRMDFSLFYFASDATALGKDGYRLLLEGAKYADQNGFTAVWTPERHFHDFGGLYPNPSVTSAAIAAITSRIQIRAGSIVLPLHNPVRVAEEWSVVDNLSGGRVGLSFASGWHPDDFVLAPDSYEARREIMWKGIETIRQLWSGVPMTLRNGKGAEVQIRLHPAPVQQEVPLWVTAATSAETFRRAGEIGANVLTNMLGQDRGELEEKIALYRAARRDRGHAGPGRVSLMLHTHIGDDTELVREVVRGPFSEYLRTSTDLIRRAAWYFPAFARSEAGGSGAELDGASPADVDALLAHAFERYFETVGLFGTPESCLAMVSSLQAIGVDEIACLIDFGVEPDEVLSSLTHLNRLRGLCAPGTEAPMPSQSLAALIRQRHVTHLQCTPTLARVLIEDPEVRVALGSLSFLLLGGEPLPKALLNALSGEGAPGAILNMYGPTETTVWSSVARVTHGEAITVGHPIVNTSFHILDYQKREVPVGVAGELYIGGAGVARGYLDQPALTRERFLESPLGGDQRLYRTGDMARRGADGSVEILGRVDQQVKLRGRRVELGEVEGVLCQHPSVQQAVVVVRQNGHGEDELVAHVVVSSSGEQASARNANWTALWDLEYADPWRVHPNPDPVESKDGSNMVGWRSSYTGEAIPENEMREWVSDTTGRILELFPRRVLEIGCGTGLLLLRVAPHVDRYVGVDASEVALSLLETALQKYPMAQVSLVRATADELSAVPEEPYDTIVINSVIQYFPDVSYLLRVLTWAVDHLSPGGAVLVGDVRSLPLLEAFHTSLELHQSTPLTSREEIHSRVRRRLVKEAELVVDPKLFSAFARTNRDVADVLVTLKRGRSVNEMTKFRYDVVLRKRATAQSRRRPSPPERTLPASEVRSAADVLAELRRAPGPLRVLGLPNARLARDLRATALLAVAGGARTAGELRAYFDGPAEQDRITFEPEDLWNLDAGYQASLTWTEGNVGAFDALLVPRIVPHQPDGLARAARLDAAGAVYPWESYVHRPPAAPPPHTLLSELRRHLRAHLPEPLVPAAFVFCQALPLTPNGKVDRGALTLAESLLTRPSRPDHGDLPEGEVESVIAEIWSELLGVSQVGRDDNIGDLGASSLVIMSANARIRASLGRYIPLVEMFRFPTIALLAAHLGAAADDSPASSPAVLVAAAERARLRKEARARQGRGAARRAGGDPT